MSEFHDPDLRQQLGRLSGPYPDDNVAFAAWQRRVGQARRRRAMAWITGAALSLIVATVAVAAVQAPTRHSLVPGKSSETRARLTVSVPTTEADESSTTESTEPETAAPTTLAPETTPSSQVETSVPETEAPEADGSGSNGSSNKGSGGSPTPAAPAATGATQTFDSPGGSITVHQNGDRLTVVATNPAGGFQVKEDDHSGGKVRVTFKSGDQQFEITVRLSNGAMKSSVADNSDIHHETPPDDSTGGGHHGGGGGDADGGERSGD